MVVKPFLYLLRCLTLLLSLILSLSLFSVEIRLLFLVPAIMWLSACGHWLILYKYICQMYKLRTWSKPDVQIYWDSFLDCKLLKKKKSPKNISKLCLNHIYFLNLKVFMHSPSPIGLFKLPVFVWFAGFTEEQSILFHIEMETKVIHDNFFSHSMCLCSGWSCFTSSSLRLLD